MNHHSWHNPLRYRRGDRLAAHPLLITLQSDEPPYVLEPEDAETAGTLMQVYSTEFGRAQARQKARIEITPGMLAEAAARVEFQRQQGMALLSDSARDRLAPVLDGVHGALQDMVKGRLNPIQAGARMASAFDQVEAQGGGISEDVQYTPYEWSRLARTEAAFADSAAREGEINSWGEVDWGPLERHGGHPPIHPNCMCSLGTIDGADGKLYAVLNPAYSACDICLSIAEAIDAEIP